MKRVAILLLLTALSLPLWASVSEPGTALTTQIISSSLTRTVLTAQLDAMAIQRRAENPSPEEGIADGLGVWVAVAGHGTPRARITHLELGAAVSVAADVSALDIAASQEDVVVLGDPMILHDLRLVSVAFRPLLRDPSGSVRIVSRVEMDITTSGNGLNEKDDPVSLSSAFYPLYRQFVSNLDDLYPNVSLNPPGRYLVLGPQFRIDSLLVTAQFQRWLDMKKRKGYTVQIAALGDSSLNGVRQFIQQTYNDPSLPSLEYCVIVGDANEIPSFSRANPEHSSEYSVGDHLYFTLAGNDLMADVFYGRVSGTTRAEYQTYFNKAYRYEVEPFTDDPAWFGKALGVAGNYVDGSRVYPVTPVWNVRWARERLLRNYCMESVDTCFFHDPTDLQGACTAPIFNAINSGLSLVLYRGWASQQLWQYPIFGVDEVADLTNGRRTPAVFAVVCGSADFHFTSTCLGEKFTTGIGTPNDVEGAIMYFGATDLHTNTRHNNAVLAGIIEAMVAEGIRSPGALQMAGKMEGWRQFPLEEVGGENSSAFFYVLHVFNLLGDPETPLTICQPGTFYVAAPTPFTLGENLAQISVSANQRPVPGAVVTVRMMGGDIMAVATTDDAGIARLPVNFISTGTAQLTVWKAQYFMRYMDIPVQNAAFDPRISSVNWTAGSDNLPNPGEPVTFTLSVSNPGTAPTTPSITITSLDPRITINTGTATISSVAPNQSAISSALAITLGSEMYNGEHPVLQVQFQDGSNIVVREMQVPVAAPDPVITQIAISGDDNGNGIFEAGEHAQIWVTIRNAGGQDAQNLTAVGSTWDNSISFVTNTAAWTNPLLRGETRASDYAFPMQLASGVTPGRQVQLRFEFHHGNAIIARKTYLLPTGLVTRRSPTGPDAFGYYAYENTDTGYTARPTYQWVELDPAHGGSNALAHPVHDDTFFGMELPQSFTYYGQAYDSVWICSNGWFSFERVSIPEFRNWELPSPMGAPSLVAPFWDDLMGDRFAPNDDTLLYVWTRHDDSPNRFVIEWRAFARPGLPAEGSPTPNMAFCTFEAILEFSGGSRDALLFQYDQITQIDNSQINGNYGTVGIEDSNHERGLTLTYANAYPPSVDTLCAGRAIRITTVPPDEFLAANETPTAQPKEFMLYDAYPNPFNPVTELRFDLPQTGFVSLRAYDVLGREAAVLVNEIRAAGSYRVTFDANQLPTGLYFARLTAGHHTMVRKLMLVK
jgi:hypothetical protein